jgi:Zn-dependent M28 family amino/carboxypeptidase
VQGVGCSNLEVNLAGAEKPEEIILIGAHYDSVFGSPGANDNGSGVAVLLELSRALAKSRLAKTVRFVAFVNEEPPFYHSKDRGSLIYAREARRKRENIAGVIVLETIGCFKDDPHSQDYPPLVKYFYPDTANFIAFVSNIRSRGWLKQVTESFRASTDFPVERLAIFPPIAPGVSWSDHSSFWKFGYRALMATDTAFYRYPYYHTPQDTPEKLNYAAMAKLAEGLVKTVARIAGESGDFQL